MSASRPSTVAILLVDLEGNLLLQQRDKNPYIVNAGLISAFGGAVDSAEEPIDAALREISEETNLQIEKKNVKLFGKYIKNLKVHGEDRMVWVYTIEQVDKSKLEIYEGTGFVKISPKTDLNKLELTILIREVITDFFEVSE